MMELFGQVTTTTTTDVADPGAWFSWIEKYGFTMVLAVVLGVAALWILKKVMDILLKLLDNQLSDFPKTQQDQLTKLRQIRGGMHAVADCLKDSASTPEGKDAAQRIHEALNESNGKESG